MGLESGQNDWDKTHEYQTPPVLRKYCSEYLLWAGRCAECSEQWFPGQAGLQRLPSSSEKNLGSQRSWVERFGTRSSCILCKELSSYPSPPGGWRMPLWVMIWGQKLSAGYGLAHSRYSVSGGRAENKWVNATINMWRSEKKSQGKHLEWLGMKIHYTETGGMRLKQCLEGNV